MEFWLDVRDRWARKTQTGLDTRRLSSVRASLTRTAAGGGCGAKPGRKYYV